MMNVSRPTVYKWWQRWQREGDAGLHDRSSRPHRCPHQTSRQLERRIERLRRSRKLGPARIAGIVEMHASTVHRVLVRQRLNRLRWMDRPTGRVIRRIETSRPGELVHVDTKKLSRIPRGGGWRGSRLRDAPHHPQAACRLRQRAQHDRRVQPRRVQRDPARRGRRALHRRSWTRRRVVRRPRRHDRTRPDRQRRRIPQPRAGETRCAELGIVHTRTRPYTPRTNGKVGALQPDAARRMGLRPDLPVRPPATPTPLTAGSTSTTITAATPPSTANHPSAASTTCQGRTANARLTIHGRRLELIDRILTGRPVAHCRGGDGDLGGDGVEVVAAVASRRRRRSVATGRADRIAHRIRHRGEWSGGSSSCDRSKKLGPARIGGIVGMHPSTVHRVLVRQGPEPAPDDRSGRPAGDPPYRDDPAG